MRQTKLGTGIVPYYQSEKYSTWVLATGDTGFRPFNNVESANLRNYNKAQNLFQNNQGRILAIKAELHAASYGRISFPMPSENTNPTALDELNKLVAQGRLQIQQDSQVVHEALLSSIIEPLPVLVFPAKIGTPTATYNSPSVVNSEDSSIMIKGAQKEGTYFSPPLFVAQGRTIDFYVTMPSGYSVPASLNNFIVKFHLVTEEIPQANLSQVR